MRVFLIDFENVGQAGFRGHEKLCCQDKIILLYSEHAAQIDIELLTALQKRLDVECVKVSHLGSNALDLLLLYLAGEVIGSTKESTELVIVSKDHIFDAVHQAGQINAQTLKGTRCISRRVESLAEYFKVKGGCDCQQERSSRTSTLMPGFSTDFYLANTDQLISKCRKVLTATREPTFDQAAQAFYDVFGREIGLKFVEGLGDQWRHLRKYPVEDPIWDEVLTEIIEQAKNESINRLLCHGNQIKRIDLALKDSSGAANPSNLPPVKDHSGSQKEAKPSPKDAASDRPVRVLATIPGVIKTVNKAFDDTAGQTARRRRQTVQAVLKNNLPGKIGEQVWRLVLANFDALADQDKASRTKFFQQIANVRITL